MKLDPHSEYIIRNGYQYRYDADYDCYYRVISREEYDAFTHWEKYGWLWITAILCAICYYVEFIT